MRGMWSEACEESERRTCTQRLCACFKGTSRHLHAYVFVQIYYIENYEREREGEDDGTSYASSALAMVTSLSSSAVLVVAVVV